MELEGWHLGIWEKGITLDFLGFDIRRSFRENQREDIPTFKVAKFLLFTCLLYYYLCFPWKSVDLVDLGSPDLQENTKTNSDRWVLVGSISRKK